MNNIPKEKKKHVKLNLYISKINVFQNKSKYVRWCLHFNSAQLQLNKLIKFVKLYYFISKPINFRPVCYKVLNLTHGIHTSVQHQNTQH